MSDRHTHILRAVSEIRRAARSRNIELNFDDGEIFAHAALDAITQRQWFAIATKHMQEKRAVADLRKKNFTVYRPKVYRHRDDDDFDLYGAMDYRIPGYVFVLIDLRPESGELTQARHAKGIEDMVMGATGDERQPVALPPGAIEKLREFEDQDFDHATMKRPDVRADLREGVDVVIDDKDHVLFGQSGVLMYLDAKVSKVLIGGKYWTVDPLNLKTVEKPKKAKNSKRGRA